MSDLSRKWTFLDHAATPLRLHCESVQADTTDEHICEFDPAQASEAVVAYGLDARRIYDALKRVIGQTGGLLILAETTGKRDAIDLPSLVHAEEILADAREKLANLAPPVRLEPHRRRMEAAARLTDASIAALRGLRMNAAGIDLGPALANLSRAYKLLQGASESRFGMMMVDFRHACCTCGALR